MTKTERKVIEKLARSAYALHLYEGLTIHGNYTLGEVIRYWRTAKEDVGCIAPDYVRTDVNIFLLLENYQRHVAQLEDEIAERVADPLEPRSMDRATRVEVEAERFPETFEVRAFPGVPLRICRTFSYVNDSNVVQLVLDRVDGKGQFGKHSPDEIRSQIAEVR